MCGSPPNISAGLYIRAPIHGGSQFIQARAEPPSFLDRRLRRQMEQMLGSVSGAARGEFGEKEMGFQASLSGYLTSEGRGASGETRPDAACQPCRCLPKINQLYLSSKPLISEQEENGLAIKLEREGEFIALSHFTFHGYFTSVLIYTCQSNSYH